MGLADAVKRVGLGSSRPLLLGNVRSRIKALLDERTPVYESVAVVAVDTDGKSPEDVAAEVRSALEARPDVGRCRVVRWSSRASRPAIGRSSTSASTSPGAR